MPLGGRVMSREYMPWPVIGRSSRNRHGLDLLETTRERMPGIWGVRHSWSVGSIRLLP